MQESKMMVIMTVYCDSAKWHNEILWNQIQAANNVFILPDMKHLAWYLNLNALLFIVHWIYDIYYLILLAKILKNILGGVNIFYCEA